MSKVINFRNVVQLALWNEELVGQISDGQWENARPDDHWHNWSDAKAEINPANLGRNFHTQKDNYNFTSKDFLDGIDNRMLDICRAAVGQGFTMENMIFELKDMKKIIRTISK